MSRFEGKIEQQCEATEEAAEILAALARQETGELRRDAVSCYFSASEGWREASNLLGGAFANPEPMTRSGGKK